MKFAIIIPTYYERENLEKLLPILVQKYPASPIFVVDDNSKDGTELYLTQLSKSIPHVVLIKRPRKRGRGSAVKKGLKQALKIKGVNYFLEMDADFSHSPDDILKLLDRAGEKTIVVGSRYLKKSKIINWPVKRLLLSRLANFYTKAILAVPLCDYTNGFRLYPREAVKIIAKTTSLVKGYAQLAETAFILNKYGFSFVEVPTTFVNRKKGVSKTDWKEYLRSLVAILRIRLKH